MKNEFKKAADVVSAMFSGFDSASMKTANSFVRSWKEIVGERISDHSKVIDVDKGLLVIEVDHPGWSQEIQFRKDRVLKTLAAQFPEMKINNLTIRVSSECKTPYKRQDDPVGSGIYRVNEEEVECEMSPSIQGDLKEVLERLKESIKKGKLSGS